MFDFYHLLSDRLSLCQHGIGVGTIIHDRDNRQGLSLVHWASLSVQHHQQTTSTHCRLQACHKVIEYCKPSPVRKQKIHHCKWNVMVYKTWILHQLPVADLMK